MTVWKLAKGEPQDWLAATKLSLEMLSLLISGNVVVSDNAVMELDGNVLHRRQWLNCSALIVRDCRLVQAGKRDISAAKSPFLRKM